MTLRLQFIESLSQNPIKITDWERISNSQPLNIHPSEKMKKTPQTKSPYDNTPAQALQKEKLHLYLGIEL